jgi:HAMP domain-containing protein
MGLRLIFNLVLLGVFLVGFLASGFMSWRLLKGNAEDEVYRAGQLMMESALAIRGYTVEQIKPVLDPMLSERFLPQTVPAFSATETLQALKVKYPDFAYKEAVLNPTNPRDKSDTFETPIINRMRADPKLLEIRGERTIGGGRALYVARPITIKSPTCMQCHDKAETAPATMLAIYGGVNGFGWKVGEIVGAQIVTVPTAVAEATAKRTFFTFMGSLAAVFAAIFLALNLMLNRLILRPIERISSVAEDISTGQASVPEFDATGPAEIAGLERAFNRMRRSLTLAMRRLDK